MLALTDSDLRQIDAKGMTQHTIERQLASFRTGIPYTVLDRPCTIEDGIMTLSDTDLGQYTRVFQQAMERGRVRKFVPASGAASRMFKTLLATLERSSPSDASSTYQELLDHSQDTVFLKQFFEGLTSFPFCNELCMRLGCSASDLHGLHWETILKTLLFSPGLRYASLPQALLQFHRYRDHVRTPIEEHMMEGAAYARDQDGLVRLHFTISPEHETLINQQLLLIRERVEKLGIQLDLTFSYQEASTDTLAVDLENQPFRDEHGALLFRPGGHGALLTNLHHLGGDIVFLKNIDNVVPDRLAEQANVYKKALGGYLVSIQQRLFTHLESLEENNIRDDSLCEIFDFAQRILGVSISDRLRTATRDAQRTFLIQRLNRPLRVCGMVPNTGEPGGGPFWARHQDGTCSRQIVESSQVDPSSASQQDILRTSTHFNPVDLVCGVKNYQGQAFNLFDFTDPNTGFISKKSYQGRELKALELPGLWNGAMADWHTIFVEVPASTFNPVKTVLDLLRPEHQAT